MALTNFNQYMKFQSKQKTMALLLLAIAADKKVVNQLKQAHSTGPKHQGSSGKSCEKSKAAQASLRRHLPNGLG